MAMHELIGCVIDYYKNIRSVEHSLKVYAYAQGIGGGEGLTGDDMTVIEAAALLHDVGIPAALKIHGSAAGEFQEKEGAAIAPELLEKGNIPERLRERVRWLVGHHHTEALAKDDRLLQILMEADYLVNLAEGNLPGRQPMDVCDSFFVTETGKRYLRDIFLSS